jgi:hypothetical protein
MPVLSHAGRCDSVTEEIKNRWAERSGIRDSIHITERAIEKLLMAQESKGQDVYLCVLQILLAKCEPHVNGNVIITSRMFSQAWLHHRLQCTQHKVI